MIESETGICTNCRGPVHIEIDTDGDGSLQSFVKPCPRCSTDQTRAVGKMGAGPRPNPTRTPKGDPYCEGCGEALPKKRGRPRKYCDGCGVPGPT